MLFYALIISGIVNFAFCLRSAKQRNLPTMTMSMITACANLTVLNLFYL